MAAETGNLNEPRVCDWTPPRGRTSPRSWSCPVALCAARARMTLDSRLYCIHDHDLRSSSPLSIVYAQPINHGQACL